MDLHLRLDHRTVDVTIQRPNKIIDILIIKIISQVIWVSSGFLTVFFKKKENIFFDNQCTKKEPSRRARQVHFPAEHVNFHFQPLDERVPRQVLYQINKRKLRPSQGNQTLRATCPKLEFKFFFSSPVCCHQVYTAWVIVQCYCCKKDFFAKKKYTRHFSFSQSSTRVSIAQQKHQPMKEWLLSILHTNNDLCVNRF